MKQFYYLLICLLPLSVMAKEPSWAKRLPMADNNTYEYRCDGATGITADEAEQKAMAKVLRGTIVRLGLPVNQDDIIMAMSNGTPLEQVINMYHIPVNKVCSFSEKLDGGYRCYLLCQVGIHESISPIWTSFNKCGQTSSTDVVEIDFPLEWKQYEGEEYFASFKHEQFEKDTKESEAIETLLELAERELRNKLGVDEGDADFLTYTDHKSYYNSTARKDGEDGFVVLFIARKQLLYYYRSAVEISIENVNQSLDEAEELVETGQKGEAEIQLMFAQQQLNDAIRNTNRQMAYGVDISSAKSSHARLQKKIHNLQEKVKGDTKKGKRDKINNYIDIAVEAQQDARISEALKYYYWANVLVNSMEPAEANLIQRNGQTVTVWLPKQINDLLRAITFSYAGASPEDPEIGMINVSYQKKPVKSLDYQYFTNSGWSEQFRAKDGVGVLRFYEDENKEKKLILRIEYTFAGEANVDKEIISLLEKYPIDYSREATKNLNLNKITAVAEETITLPIKVSTNSFAKAGTGIKEGKYAVQIASLTEEECRPYKMMIDNICEAIRTRKGSTVMSYFTPQGKRLFLQLTKSGRISIMDKKNISFYRLGDNVVARAVRMSFDYPNNHKTFVEDVVFEFDAYKKVDNIRYMLERGTMEDIASQDDWSDAAKLALTDFLENYKSSFALRDTNYLYNVFDNNAIIITGRVITALDDKPQNGVGSTKEQIVYTRHTKQSYLKALSRTFNSNSFVNVAFSDLFIERDDSYKDSTIFGLRLKQIYSSQHYGDQGYLFLLMDLTNYEKPIIYVRTWQPKPDTDLLPGNGLFGLGDFNN